MWDITIAEPSQLAHASPGRRRALRAMGSQSRPSFIRPASAAPSVTRLPYHRCPRAARSNPTSFSLPLAHVFALLWPLAGSSLVYFELLAANLLEARRSDYVLSTAFTRQTVAAASLGRLARKEAPGDEFVRQERLVGRDISRRPARGRQTRAAYGEADGTWYIWAPAGAW